jgi:hypothetical protein
MGAFIDLTGQRFGRLVVIEKSVERINSSSVWICRCDCGVPKKTSSDRLRQGKVTSCGSGKCKTGFVDLTGRTFGKWTVIEITENMGYRTYKWLCMCDCGTIREVDGETLRMHKSMGCGDGVCHSQFIDISGQKFGKLEVISPTKNRIYGELAWLCKCECGKRIEVKGAKLNGQYPSCGDRLCRHTYRDLTGMTFNRLTAICYTHTLVNDYWDFKCECGNIVNILALNVTKQHTKSCGCLKRDREYESIVTSAYRSHLRGLSRGSGPIENFLSKEEYVSIASQECHYCGLLGVRRNKQTGAQLKMNGIDRKNNERCYKIENSLPCCPNCNAMKMDIPYNDFILKIRNIFEHTKNISLDPKGKTESDQ